MRSEVAEEGALWSVRAKDWAAVQEKFLDPCYMRILDLTGITEGDAVLDVGCGAGRFLELAAGRGASITGLDASSGMLEIARSRNPYGEFHLGDMDSLPFSTDCYDLVTGFNSFSHSDDPQRALMEAGRVAKKGKFVALTVWGPPEQGSMRSVVFDIVHTLLGDAEHPKTAECCGSESHDHPTTAKEVSPGLTNADPSVQPGSHIEQHVHSITAEDDLEELAQAAGLLPAEAGEVECRFTYPDREVLLKGLMSPAPLVEAEAKVGRDALEKAIVQAMERFKTASGGYSFSNKFRYLVANSRK